MKLRTVDVRLLVDEFVWDDDDLLELLTSWITYVHGAAVLRPVTLESGVATALPARVRVRPVADDWTGNEVTDVDDVPEVVDSSTESTPDAQLALDLAVEATP